MEFRTQINNYLWLKDKYGKIQNQQILVVARSGWGKGLTTEGLMEEFYKAGYLVLFLADPKKEWEFAYQMFEPEEKYHLDHLRKIGKTPQAKPVKLYHPFTFNIPVNEKLPDINFYSFNLKDFGRDEFGLLFETESDSEVMKLVNQASKNITKEDGLYGFLHYIQNAIKGKVEGKHKRYDPKNFYLESSTGTMKSMSEISSTFQPFQREYFINKENCSSNLNWRQILNDRHHIHVFGSVWVNDDKIRNLIVACLLSGLIKNKRFLKCPVLIVINEINELCPYKPEGSKKYLSKIIKRLLGMLRSSGRGMSSIIDSQSWTDVDEEVRNKSTISLIGELKGGIDIERLSKAYTYPREIRDQLKNMPYMNSYFIIGKEKDEGPQTFWFSSSCHAEPNYNFLEFYRKRLPNKLKTYKELYERMKKMHLEEENKYRDKTKKKEKQDRELREKLKKEREQSKSSTEKIDEVKEKVKQVEKKGREQLMKLCYEEKKLNPDISFRNIGKKFGISNHTAKSYIDEYSEKIEGNKEE